MKFRNYVFYSVVLAVIKIIWAPGMPWGIVAVPMFVYVLLVLFAVMLFRYITTHSNRFANATLDKLIGNLTEGAKDYVGKE